MTPAEANVLLTKAAITDRWLDRRLNESDQRYDEFVGRISELLEIYSLEEALAALDIVQKKEREFEVANLITVMNQRRHSAPRKPSYLSIPGHYGPGGPDGDLLRANPDRMPELE